MKDSDKLRTRLANERTLLAYIRTALAVMIFGMGAIKFFADNPLIVTLGWLFLLCGFLTLIWGISHFRHLSKLIEDE